MSDNRNIINNIPTLALRGIVVFPEMVVNFDVVRKKSIEALNVAMASDRYIFLLTQKNIAADDPNRDDLYDVGCVARIKQILRLKDDTVRVLVEGCYRAKCLGITASAPSLYTDILRLDDEPIKCRPVYKDALIRSTKNAFDDFAHMVPKMSPDIIMSVMAADNLGYLADFIAHNIQVDFDDKQYILEQINPQKRIKLIISLLKQLWYIV